MKGNNMSYTNYEKFDPSKIALFDLDGTLVDFDGAMRRDLNSMASPTEKLLGPEDDIWDEKVSWLEARKNFIKNRPGWWRMLPRFQLGWDVLNQARKTGFDITILTKGPYLTTTAWTEKVDWCRGNLPYTKVTITEDKSTAYGRVLVDDWPKYIGPWLIKRPRGLVIMPAHPWNMPEEMKAFPKEYFDRIVRYDGTNIDQVKEALQKAFDR
jgi:hypothetical protein